MAQVSLKQLTKRFDEVLAVNNVNLEIKDQEFMVLVGPSGCGKTTILRMVAGLEDITEGDIHIGERLVNDLASKDRNIAMVFQNYALYPHMKVFDNMAFGLKMRKISKEERTTLVNEAADILGIRDLLNRKPKQLSGGQRQRVALGRAIVRKPDVFLFDEPLSNLDAKLRVQMRTELIKLHARLKSTSIYVTHDQVEAMTMGDRIVVMNNAVLQQVGSPLDLYNTPANRFVASFIGSPAMNFLDCILVEDRGDLFIQTSGFRIRLPGDLHPGARESGASECVFGVRPEDVAKKGEGERSSKNSEPIKAQINTIETLGKETCLNVTAGDDVMTAIIRPDIHVNLRETIDLEINMEKIHLFNKDDGAAIL